MPTILLINLRRLNGLDAELVLTRHRSRRRGARGIRGYGLAGIHRRIEYDESGAVYASLHCSAAASRKSALIAAVNHLQRQIIQMSVVVEFKDD